MSKKPRFAFDVFISYSHKDTNWVKGILLPRLENAGLKAFIDYRDFDVGAASIKEMERGVKQSKKTLVVLTPDYLKSGWTDFEILMSQTLSPANRNRRVIPVLRKDCKLPVSIRYMNYVDLANPKDKEPGWKRLIEALGGKQFAQKILVVDDTKDVRETIGGVLKDNGYEVYMAEDENSALQIFQDTSIEFAVIDIRLHDAIGDESGLKLASAIYALAPHIQTVILSGSTKPRHKNSATSFGVVDYILKTTDWEDRLLKAIKEHPRKSAKK